MRLFNSPLAATLLLLSAAIASADWLQFRGPGGFGVAPDKDTPVTWSANNNLAWKTPLPGPGASSPIVVGNKVLLTCYSGYALDKEDPGEPKNLKLHVVCADR